MGWIDMLGRTYDMCSDIVGKEINEDSVLLPLAHSTANAQIELTVDMDGNVVKELTEQVVKNGRNEITIIPVTEDSASRTNGNFPHGLCDKLCYVAGDYSAYTGEQKEEYYEEYAEGLRRWVESEYTHPWVRAVYAYIKKKSMIADLVAAGCLKLDEAGMLSDKENKIHQLPQRGAVVRFAVYVDGQKKKLWKSQELYALYQNYYYGTLQERSICYVSGVEEICTEKHPSKIRNTADKAKLISGNDDVGFTYRGRFEKKSEAATVGYQTSQKAHNALRWLLQKQGYKKDESAVVVWKLSEKTEGATQEESFSDVPDIFVDTVNAFPFDWDAMGQQRENEELDTGILYARQMKKAMEGYAGKFQADDRVLMMALDAATTGRLSITYYHEFAGNDFIRSVIHWHENCTWEHWVRLKESAKTIRVESAPSPREMALAAFGTEHGNGYLDSDKRLIKTTVQRILPCIVGLKPVIPADIVRAAVRRASNPLAYRDFVWRNQVFAVACAMIKYNDYKGKVDVMELEKDRSYLFGRLLAVTESVEHRALYTVNSNNSEERLTNAKKLWNAYTRRPAQTYKRLYEKITQGYIGKLKYGSRVFYENEMMEIVTLLQDTDGFHNKPLKKEYLLGYYEQRKKMMGKNEDREGGNE